MSSGLRREDEAGHVTRRSITRRRFNLPAWWMGLAPSMPAGFWIKVEREREAAGARRGDVGAITYIVRRLKAAQGARR